MYNIYMYMMKYIHILYVDTSLISKNARIDHHFQRKREFGKKSIFQTFENSENLAFLR